jgi:hypothetical protein
MRIFDKHWSKRGNFAMGAAPSFDPSAAAQ